MTTVALAVSAVDPELYTDGPPLIDAFGRAGIDIEVVAWGRGPRWDAYDAVLIRGTYDYIYDRDGFLTWAAHVASVTRLANSIDVLRWNTDKRYLRDLAAAGVPTVPTLWVEPREAVPEVPWDDFVVKPSVSAGARLSARYRGDGRDVAAHVGRIHRTGAAAMFQPYLASIDTVGERGTYVFGREVTHSIAKGAILEPGRGASDELDAGSHQLVGPAPTDDALADFARRAVAAAPPVLYARVDTAGGPDGSPLLIELEATEPYLFLEHAPAGAADAFVRATAAWLAAEAPPRRS